MLAQRSGLELSIFGNVVTVRTPWVVAVLAALVLTWIEIAPRSLVDGGSVNWYANALVLIAGTIGSILSHEAAHAAASHRLGGATSHISIYPLGGASDDFNLPGTPRQETITALAGPFASACIGGVLVGAWALARHSSSALSDDLIFLGAANLVLAVVNLLPGYPLDGGRVFRALVWYLHDDFSAGTRAAVTYGQVISTFALAGGLVVLGSRTSWSVLGVWIILAAWGAARVGRYETTRSLLISAGGSLTAGDAVRGLNPHVRADQPLDEVLEALLAEMSSGPGLVMDDGKVIGIVSLSRLRRYRRTEWSRTRAREAMIPLHEARSIDESVTVRRLLNELTEGHTDLLFVTGPDGVVGALDRRIALEKLIDRVQAARYSR